MVQGADHSGAHRVRDSCEDDRNPSDRSRTRRSDIERAWRTCDDDVYLLTLHFGRNLLLLLEAFGVAPGKPEVPSFDPPEFAEALEKRRMDSRAIRERGEQSDRGNICFLDR